MKKKNISLWNVTQFYLVLDEVNQYYLPLAKSTAKPTSCSLKILASSYSTASIRGSEKRQCSTAASQNPHTHCHHKSAITSVS